MELERVRGRVRWHEPEPTEPLPDWAGALLVFAALAIEFVFVLAPRLS